MEVNWYCFTRLFIVLWGSVSTASGHDCESDESMVCRKEITAFTKFKQKYKYPNDDFTLKEMCRLQLLVTDCLTSFAKTCLIEGEQEMLKKLKKFGYLKHSKCLRNITSYLDECSKEYENSQKTLEEQEGIINNFKQRTCCLYFENINCSANATFGTCGEEASDLVRDLWTLLGGTYLNDLCEPYLNVKHTLLRSQYFDKMDDALETLGTLVYIVSPNKTTFEKVEEVPSYVIEVAPYFVFIWLLEVLIIRITKKKTIRLNDAIVSASQGLLYESTKVVTHTWQLAGYIYIYTNWRLVDLPWNSLWTWWIAVFAVDFLYYWQHRACHEVNFLWAAHQVHHSSEEYNLLTALRQSAILNFFLSIIALPIALVIPPSAFLVHLELNTLYQFWIHTEAVQSLGPLEYILNTASHHRVHHGRNRYCIDKNYGGLLIIWDRIFGTFEAESNKVIYGLTHPIQSFTLFYIQFSCYSQLWRRFVEMEGWKNKLSVLFKGPGWYPGTPRCGNIEDIPEVPEPVPKFDVPVPVYWKLYAFFHTNLLLGIMIELSKGRQGFPSSILYGVFMFIVFSLTNLGMLLEKRSYAPLLEVIRCALYIAVDFNFWPLSRMSLLPQDYKIILLYAIRISEHETFFMCKSVKEA
ncbi:hypothetical protein JTE90_000146 [Oedothorax gibbosus]|uniref:Alkylglycerol monooxygenase n=1 Tax=Oedothorax gibbosus TaxID=931172 RepID=A0AAV6U3R8_9ARAC|nr:hypothetical protein JTE90_000146 [Oedothorax gibbosus]